MVSSLLVVIGIVIWGYTLTNTLKIKEGFGPVLGVAVSMAVLELGGAFGILWPVASIYCAIVCILSAACIIRTRRKVDIKTYFFNPAVIGFLFASFFYMVLSSGETLFYTAWDSFMHWGMFSKAVFYNHNLDVWNSELCINHRVYPHGMASWYALFALYKKTYAERDVMLSINVLLFASSCPIVDLAVRKIRKLLPRNKCISTIIYFLAGMSVASFLWIWRFGTEVGSFISGYMDIPLGAAFMAALCLAVTDCEKRYRKAFGVSVLSAMLVMIKPSGIIFVGVVCLVCLVNEYIGKEFHMKLNDAGKICVWEGVCISIPLLELAIWNIMMNSLGITGEDQFRLRSFLPGNVIEKYQSDAMYAERFPVIIHNFIKAFFKREMVLHISAFGWMMICVIMALFAVKCQKDHSGKKKVLYINICMLMCFCFYNVFLLWTYLTTMSKGEATGVNCYDRYIGTYMIGWFALCIYFLFLYNVGGLKIQYFYFGIFFLCNICGFWNKSTYLKEIDPGIREVYEFGNQIKECIPELAGNDMPDLWISYADREGSLNNEQIMQLKYYLFPEFDLIDLYGTQDNYGQEMRDIVGQFGIDCVVLYGVNEEFYNSYYWFFSDGLSNAQVKYENGQFQVYKVIRDETTNEFCWFEPL